jgi:anaerobic selenocysteine-containing dehydrogenase
MTPVETRTFCRACLAGCGLIVTAEADRITRVRGDASHAISNGYTCPKGRAAGAQHHRRDRLDRATVRLGGEMRIVGAIACLDDLGARLAAIIATHGPDAVGCYLGNGTGFDSTGAIAVLRFTQGLGTGSNYSALTLDCPAKPLVAELLTGDHRLTPVVDEEHARLTIYIGTNPVVSHGHTHIVADPVTRLRQQLARGQVWVVDPRRTETARLATAHLSPRPGTDHAILAFLTRELLRDGADREHLAVCTDPAEIARLTKAVAGYDMPATIAWTGLAEADLADLLAAIRSAGRVAIQTGTGVTMTAAANVTEWLAWVVQIITGSLDRRGGSVFNPGFFQRADRRRPRAAEGVSPGPASRPELASRFGEYPAIAIPDEIQAGNLRALLVFGGNPLSSLPDAPRARWALGQLEVLASLDTVGGDLTAVATHVLPCTGPFERADISLSADLWLGRYAGQYTPAVVPPTEDRHPMWWWAAHLARRLGFSITRDDPDECTEATFLAPVADASPSSFEELRSTRLVERDMPEPGWVSTNVLPGGRWRLAPEQLVAQLASVAPPAALSLIPRRQVRHLNSAYRDLGDQPDVLMHPADAARAALTDGASVVGRSGDHDLIGIARVTDSILLGCVSVPHGFAEPNVNRLTRDGASFDPLTGMPSYAAVPVTIQSAGC